MLGKLPYQVFFQQFVVLEAINGGGAGAIELEQQVTLDELVDSRIVVEGPRSGRVSGQHIVTEGDIGFIVAQQVEQGGRDVGLLHNHVVA